MRSLLLIGTFALLGASAMVACSNEEDDGAPVPLPPGSGGQTGTGGAAGGPTLPALGGCYPTDPKCGIPGSSCLAREIMKGKDVKTLRLGQLQITSPQTLASNVVANLVGNAITQVSNKTACHVFATQPGNFNFLIEVDTVKKTIFLGGGLPQADPNAGYCFVTRTFANGIETKPVTIPIAYDEATGVFGTTSPLELAVPIFDPKNDPNLEAPILLPLKGTNLTNIQLTEDGACIGRFRGEPGELDGDCDTTTTNAKEDDYYPFKSGGSLDGYITVADADNVVVRELNATLCSLLSGQTNKPKCAGEDGTIVFAGSAVKPDLDIDGDGVNDAYSLAAKISGSAVKTTGSCP